MDGDIGSIEVYRLHILLHEISPAIWRRVLVRSDSTIEDLHYIMQLLMGWSDYHLNRFTIHGKGFGVFHVGGTGFSDDPSKVHLSDFEFRPKERFLYEYDYIDEWKLDLRLEHTLSLDPKRNYPFCIGGKRAGPPEDCGGPRAFMAWEDEFAPHNVAFRIQEMQEDQVDDREAYIYELGQFEWWTKKEQFDRKAINRKLNRYANGDEGWESAFFE